MNKKNVVIIFTITLFIAGMAGFFQNVTAQSETRVELLIQYVNQYRLSKGLDALTPDPHLMQAAQVQAEYLVKTYDMQKGGDGSVGEGGTSASDRAYQYGYAPWKQYEVVENWVGLYKEYPLENVVGNDWWKIAYNQKNLLDGWGTTYEDIGVGIASQGNVTFYIIDIGVRYDTSERLVVTNAAGESVSIMLVQTVTPQADGSVVHTVQEGETMQSIAQSYGVSVDAIKQLNGLAQASIISVGQRLVIISISGAGPTSIDANATEIPSPTYTQMPTYTLYPTRTPEPIQFTATPIQDDTETPSPESNNQMSLGIWGLIIVGMGIAIIAVMILYTRLRK